MVNDEAVPQPKPKFTAVGYDDWSRRLLKSVKTGRTYVEVDGGVYGMTDWGEPISPICSLDDIEIVEGETNEL